LEIQIGDSTVDQVVLLSPQLLTDAILGLDFLIGHEAEISFPDRTVCLMINEKFCTLEFQGAREATKEVAKASFKKFRNFAISFTLPCFTAHLSANSDIGQQRHLERTAAMTGDKLEVTVRLTLMYISVSLTVTLICDGLPHCEDACDVTNFPRRTTYPVEKLNADVTMPLD